MSDYDYAVLVERCIIPTLIFFFFFFLRLILTYDFDMNDSLAARTLEL